MCLLFYCHNAHADYPFILLANRDEFYERPTQAADFWPEAPSVLAGRDLRRGGTWLGITRTGRWAALTNVREPSRGEFERSRGEIVQDYLCGEQAPRDFAAQLQAQGDEFDGFNLLFGDREESLWLSNRAPDTETTSLQPGIHGLSNHLLETPWPKVSAGKRALDRQLRGTPYAEQLFGILSDPTPYRDNLPDTGVSPELEHLLSSAFISGEHYGTRSSTLIMIDRDARVYFEERSYRCAHGSPVSANDYEPKAFRFRLD